MLIIFVSCDKQNDDHTSSHFYIDKDYYEIIQWRDQTINITSGSGDLQISTPNADKIQLSYEKGLTESGIKPKKPYSGNLNVRLTPEIHSRLAVLVQQAGTTINGYIRQTLAKATGVIKKFVEDILDYMAETNDDNKLYSWLTKNVPEGKKWPVKRSKKILKSGLEYESSLF